MSSKFPTIDGEESYYNPPMRHWCGSFIIATFDKESNPRPEDPGWKGHPVPYCPTCSVCDRTKTDATVN